MGDPAAVSQCLQNLVTNALKYGQAGRWIGIQARTAEGVGGAEIQVSVSDRGIGIERSELGRIFEPFYRSPSPQIARIRGTGLGTWTGGRSAGAATAAPARSNQRAFDTRLPLGLKAVRVTGRASVNQIVPSRPRSSFGVCADTSGKGT
jgi:Histidine kinase-, DNA gyrase B-, and HSP90-like ATPase